MVFRRQTLKKWQLFSSTSFGTLTTDLSNYAVRSLREAFETHVRRRWEAG
jgi:hypothetical protein